MNQRQLLLLGFRAGAADLRRHAALLNRINVFPVVDGDTGTNMAQSLEPGARLAEQPDIATGCARFTSSLVRNGQGNSGVILSQFLFGFFDSLDAHDSLSPSSLAEAAQRGVDLSYASVQQPVEGTILTAMTRFASALAEVQQGWTPRLVGELAEQMLAAVSRTRETMPRLREAGVVDAGALGFHILLAGVALAFPGLKDVDSSGMGRVVQQLEQRLLGTTTAPLGDIATSIDKDFLQTLEPSPAEFRHCVTFLLESCDSKNVELCSAFDGIADSIDISRGDTLARVHLHCDDVEEIHVIASGLGSLSEFRAVEMSLAANPKLPPATPQISALSPATVRIVTDASASLSPDLCRHFGLARLQVHITGHGQTLRDDQVDSARLFQGMRDGFRYTTSQSSPALVEEFIEQTLGTCDHLVYLAMGNAYSGTQAVVRKICEEHPQAARIHVLDSRAASGQLALACLATNLSCGATEDPEVFREQAQRQINRCREYIVIDDLHYLARGGRIGRIKAGLASLLSVKPIVGHGGDAAIIYAKARNHRAAFDDIRGRIAAHPGSGPLLVLLEHTDNRSWVQQLHTQLASELPGDTEFFVTPLSPTSSVHMGPGTWGIAVTRLEKKDQQ